MSRRKDGTFAKGASGNPKGRPRSEAVELRRQLAAKGADVAKVVLDLALSGDLEACKLVLARLVPPLKASAAPVLLDTPIDPSTPLEAAQALLRATTEGTIPPDIAAALVSAIAHLAKIEEVQELRDRLAALEAALQLPTAHENPC